MGDVSTLAGAPGERSAMLASLSGRPILDVLATYEADMRKRGLNAEADSLFAASQMLRASAVLLGRYILRYGPLPAAEDDGA